jgi:hypothetical protein
VTIVAVNRNGIVWFNIALMDHCGVELAFEYVICGLEALLDITPLELKIGSALAKS